MEVLSQAVLRPHRLILPSLAAALPFAPLSRRMLAWAGVAETAPSLDRARAIVGWFAAHAVHPAPTLHPDGTTANVGVLPPGETWASFNAAFNTPAVIERDNAYWYGLFPDAGAMLQRLVGTLDAAGVPGPDGMLEEHAPGAWRIRSFAGFRAPQCTLQCKMAQIVLAAQGLHSADLSTTGHDPMMVLETETGRWLYIDPTFGEMLSHDGALLDPLEALRLSLAGEAAQIIGVRLPGADYLQDTFFAGPRLPAGMAWMTVHTSPNWLGGLSARSPHRFLDLPGQSAFWDVPAGAEALMPQLGCGIAGLARFGTTVDVRLRSSWPDHVGFERRVGADPGWNSCAPTDQISIGTGSVRYRSVDSGGFAGMEAELLV